MDGHSPKDIEETITRLTGMHLYYAASLIQEQLTEVAQLRQQRDELASALKLTLKELETVLPISGRVHSERQAIIQATAALAKIK